MTWHQIRSLSHRRRLLGGAYADKVLSYGPIAYWPLHETSGATAANLGTLGSAADGAYTGVTLNNTPGPDPRAGAPFFDGANDFVDIYSAALDAAFSGATGSALLWFKVANAGVWTDGAMRRMLYIYDDATNLFRIRKHSGGNKIEYFGNAGGGSVNIAKILNPTAWVQIAFTWSDGANDDEFKAYYNGVQEGATGTTLNTWTGGGLAPLQTLIGAGDQVPNIVWHGWLSDVALFDYVLPGPAVLDLATV